MSNQSTDFGEHEDNKMSHVLNLCAVTDGEIMKIEDVPDELFSQRLIGDGFALMPESEEVFAPVGGKLIEVADAKHAYYIETEEGIKILIHIGIDTVLLNGDGFTSFVDRNMTVEKGQKLASFDKQLLIDRGLQPVIPVIVLDHPKVKSMEVRPSKEARANETIALTVNLA